MKGSGALQQYLALLVQKQIVPYSMIKFQGISALMKISVDSKWAKGAETLPNLYHVHMHVQTSLMQKANSCMSQTYL